MKLGTRLILAFLVVALVPVGTLLVFSLSTVEDRFQDEFQERLDNISIGIKNNIDNIGSNLKTKVEELIQSEQVERILIGMVKKNLERRSLIPEAAKWMKAWDLDTLSVLDGSGEVLSCGHLPARFGSKDPDLISLLQEKPNEPVLRRIQVLRGGQIESILGVEVFARRQFNKEEVIVIGGKLLDESFVDDLENLSGAEIQIVDDDNVVIASGSRRQSKEFNNWQEETGYTYRQLDLPPVIATEERAVTIIAGVSKKKMVSAREHILWVSIGAAMAGILISWLLGIMIARWIVMPVNALVLGARQIARGEMNKISVAKTSSEIGELVSNFNTMVEDLGTYRRKLVKAERVAAWQEIARRIAHEIKNPLSPIQMSIETLRKAYTSNHREFDEIFEESTGAILEEVAALKKIVTEFSEFARMPKPTMVVQDLNQVVESVVGLYKNQKKDARLEFHPDLQIPHFAFDKEQVGRVVGNLLSNALWATGSKGSIITRTQNEGHRVLLEVADSGRGMEPEVLGKIFTPYFTTRKNGTGLGLAIVQRIIEDHGGVVEVESLLDQGTKFKIYFPADK